MRPGMRKRRKMEAKTKMERLNTLRVRTAKRAMSNKKLKQNPLLRLRMLMMPLDKARLAINENQSQLRLG
jgi:hypothetical protein